MKKIYLFLVLYLPLFLHSLDINKDHTLRLNFSSGAPKFLHPQLFTDTGGVILCNALLEGLTRLNKKGKVELAIAKKIKISKDKTKYIIYLRSSKWSNGKKLTAKHFVDAWKAAIIPNTKCNRPYRFFIIKNAKKIHEGKLPIEKLGVYTPQKNKIIVCLEHPAPYFVNLLATPTFYPLYDLKEQKVTTFNGPFQIKEFNPNKEILLKKNFLYWDLDNIKLNTIKISFIQDELTAFKLFQKNELDFIGSPLSDLPEEILKKSNNLKTTKTYGIYWIYFCLNNPKVQSKKIRKALDLAAKRELIPSFLPNAHPNQEILPQDLSFIKSKQKQVPIKDIQNLFNEGLEELGYKKKNYTIELSCSNSFRHTKVAEFLKSCWEEIFNIKVTIRKSDWNTFHNNILNQNFMVGGDARYPTFEDPLYFLEFFYSKDKNCCKWESLKFQKYLNLANKTISIKKRNEYLAKAEKVLKDDTPIISLFTNKHLYLCSPSLKGLTPSKLAYFDFKYCYFNKDSK